MTKEASVRRKELILGALIAFTTIGCATTKTEPVQNNARSQGEIVTIQYDPDNYDQTRTTAAAVRQCRAKGYSDAIPHTQQPTLNRSTWGYQAFMCVS